MNSAGQGTVLVSLFLTGLAGSLHCVGMCGPILLGFSRALGSAGGPVGQGFLLYHTGRLWTYGLLGLLAGWGGSELRQGMAHLGWQRPLAVFFSLSVIAFGAAALGLIPGLRFDLSPPNACISGTQQRPLLASLLQDPRPSARLLLGAIMGLLPCGLVYAVLVIASTFPTPVHSAVGMLCFGLGTLPALSALVISGRLVPLRLRNGGTRFAAALLLVVGLFMLARALWMPMDHSMHHPHVDALPGIHGGGESGEVFSLSGG